MSTTMSKNEIVNLSIEILIKAIAIGVVLYYALQVIKPFIIPVLWGIIIAVALAPFISKLEKVLSLKRSLVVITITLTAIGALVLPTYMLSDSIIDSSQNIAKSLQDGTMKIPMPSQSVQSWPLVGDKIYTQWSALATNLEATLISLKPHLAEYAGMIASSVAGLFGSILQFIASLIIAAFFLTKSEGSVKAYHSISRRLIGEKGVEWANLSALTIRSVVQGVIGIALIQSILAFIGLAIWDVPLAWLWGLVVMFVAIVQIPTLIVLGPIMAYMFSTADTSTATIFTIYMFLVGASDNVLKPLLLGRGVDIPMLVILLGAIGGMLLSGILGLFIGAVGLALAYKLFMTWLDDSVDDFAQEKVQA